MSQETRAKSKIIMPGQPFTEDLKQARMNQFKQKFVEMQNEYGIWVVPVISIHAVHGVGGSLDFIHREEPKEEEKAMD
jgi:hypothetical protein